MNRTDFFLDMLDLDDRGMDGREYEFFRDVLVSAAVRANAREAKRVGMADWLKGFGG